MTEPEWEACSEPQPMLTFLHGRVSDRKLRLFACACCRAVQVSIPPGPCRTAVEVALRHADGLAGDDELRQARDAAMSAADRAGSRSAAAWAACEAANPSATRAARVAAQEGVEQARQHNPRGAGAEAQAQAALLRDIVGNPFRRLWGHHVRRLGERPDVRELAEELYDRAPPDDMDALAALLERSGCASGAVLDHCRAGGFHHRGCWVLDLLLGRDGDDVPPAGTTVSAEVLAARETLAAHLCDKKYRRLLRVVLAGHRYGVSSPPGEWASFLEAYPGFDTPAVRLLDVCRVCRVHGCEVVQRSVVGPSDPPGLARAAAYLQARGTRFPHAHPDADPAGPAAERTVWWCPQCQRAWEEWDRATTLR